jgi:hypothetical protein
MFFLKEPMILIKNILFTRNTLIEKIILMKNKIQNDYIFEFNNNTK